MKQQFRKTILRLAAFMALLGIIILPGQADVAHAEGTDAGGTRAEAMEIQMDQTYSEVISDKDDEDYFKFTTTEPGYVQVTLAHDETDENAVGSGGWAIYVLDENGETLVSETGIKESWTSIAFPYAKGTTFYIQVVSHTGLYGAINCLYDLTVTQTAVEDWEVELNDTKAAATAIAASQIYHGILLNGNDTDYFQFVTTVHGYFQVQFSHNAADALSPKNGWKVRVLDERGEEITSGGSITTNWTSPILPYAEAGKTFYVEVSSQNGRYGAVNCIYDLVVNQTAASDWETEPNETMAAATSITMGKTYNGITLGSQDKDYYKVNAPASGKLKIKLTPSLSNSSGSVGSGWNIFIYDKSSKEVAKLQRVATEQSVSLDVGNGIYYIKIEPYNRYSALECQYSLLATHIKAPSKPKISSVKAGKRAAAIKWKKVSDASGYYIYRSTSKKGEYKKVKTIKKGSTVSWKNKKLKSRQKYFYKVVAYRMSDGLEVVSSYSKVKSVKVK